MDFGDMTYSGSYSSGASNAVRTVFAGSFTPSYLNIMFYVTTSTAGNAEDFGDTAVGSAPGSVSDAHGGLGGY